MGERPPPLRGIRVLDFSRIIAGPSCTQQLADLGADVVKVEHPVTGDEFRARSAKGDRRGGPFLAFNRSKRSITIDLARPAGVDLARRLAATADVVIENFRPGVMTRLGLGPDDLRADHPELVYVTISAYGRTGPNATRPGLDPVLQAESGMMALNGEPDGAPMRHPLSLIDTLTGAHAATAICAALLGRHSHGQGDVIELCLLDTAIAALGNVGTQYLLDGVVPARNGNRHVTGAPIDLFATATEPLYMAMATDKLFVDLCGALGRPEVATDARFATPGARSRHRDELKVVIEAVLVTRSADEWLTRMHHLPVGAVRTIDRALASPEVRERGLVHEIAEDDGVVRVLGAPFTFTEASLAPFRTPPRLGEHTDEVLADVLGLDPAAIDALRQAGALG